MVQRGPLPYAGWIAAICEAFHCTPAEAEAQDADLVSAVFEYRNAVTARELFNAGPQQRTAAFRAFQQNPGLGELLVRLARAQQDEDLTGDDQADALRVFSEQWQIAHRAADGDEDEDEDV